MLKEGLNHTSRLTVTLQDCASQVGSGGMDVFATPSMVALMENAAMTCVEPYLAAGDTTVGAHIATSHLRATPIGAEVHAVATLTKIEGRKLHFNVEAYQGDTLIGQGTHLRVIVNRERFLSNL